MTVQRRRWRPLERGERVPPTPEKIAAIRAEAARFDMSPDDAERLARDQGDEVWLNDRYVVIVKRHEGVVRTLSIRRQDRQPEPFPWRDLQRMKTELAGAETEAFELFPAESRLVDTANQRWLWCLPPGERIPAGFDEGRHVSGPEDAARVGARQARLDDEPGKEGSR